MKYYIGKIEERNGDFEYTSEYVFQTEGDPDEYTKKHAMEWRGSDEDDWDENRQGYWADCTMVFNDGCREIPKEDFDVLKHYLAFL